MFRNSLLVLGAMILFMAVSVCAQEGADTSKAVETKTEMVEAKPQVTEPAKSALKVEAELCTGIEERMPTGMATAFQADVGQVYLWAKIIGALDIVEVNHVWYYKGEEMATVPMTIKGPAWRTWSSKTILPTWTGDWEVKVIDADGNVLTALKFKVGE